MPADFNERQHFERHCKAAEAHEAKSIRMLDRVQAKYADKAPLVTATGDVLSAKLNEDPEVAKRANQELRLAIREYKEALRLFPDDDGVRKRIKYLEKSV